MKRVSLLLCALLGIAWIGWQDIPGEFLQRNRVYLTDFGAIPNDGQDDSKAWYKARAAVIASGIKQYEIIAPAGVYTFNQPLVITNGSGSTYQSFTLRGAGGYSSTAPNNVTVFDFSGSSKSHGGLFVQGARGVVIEDLVVLGANTAPGTVTTDHTVMTDMTDTASDWVTNGCANDTNRVHAGLVIDGFSGSAPGTPYTNITDPSDSSVVCTYGYLDSTMVTVNRVNFLNWVAGVAIKPANQDSNGDHVRLDTCHFRDCTYGVTVGNSQARGCTIEDGYWLGCMVAVECGTHGKAIGSPPVIAGGSAGYVHTLFRFPNASGSVFVHGFYAETIKSLGYFGKAIASLELSAQISGSHFKFRNLSGATATDDNDAAIHLRTFMPTHITGTSFSMQHGALNVIGNANECIFDACEFNTIDTDWNDIFYLGVNDAWDDPRITTRASQFKTNRFGITGTKWNCADTESTVLSIPSRFDLSTHSRRIQGPAYTLTVENAGSAQGVSTRTRVSASASGYSWAGSTLTFTATTVSDLLVGDVLYWQTKADTYASSQQFNVPALVVTNIASSTVTAVAFVGVDNLDTTYAPASVGIIPKNYALGAAVTGTVTSSSTSITGVTSASSYFRIGDFIAGTGIPAKTRVTNVSGTTVTISKAATATNSNVSLYFDHAWRDDVPHNSPEAFFAARDTTTDDAKPIMACLQYWGNCQLLSGSSYAINTQIAMPDYSKLWGANHQLCILRATSGFTSAVVAPGLRCTVRDLAIFGNDEATSIGLQPTSTGSGVLVDRVAIADFAEGLVLDGSGVADFTFRNGRATSCTSNNIRIGTTGMSKVTIADSVIQSSTGPGILVSGATNALTISGNDIASNGTYGIQSTASSLATTIINNHFQSNTTADCLISANSRNPLFQGNNCTSSPICFTASNGTGGTIQANTFNPSGGTTKSIKLTSTNCVRWTIGQNVSLAGAFDYATDNSGLQTRYLGSIYASGSPTQGVWEKGEQVLNSSTTTALSTPLGWNCTTAGDAAGAGVFTPFYRAPQVLVGSTTWDPGSLATGASESKDVTISGGVVGSVALAGHTAIVSGMTLNAVVTSSSNVRVTLTNVNATNPTDLSSGTVNVQVFQ